jgi:TonB family protein
MPRTQPFGVVSGWDPQIGRMVGLSALAHLALAVLVVAVIPLLKPWPAPITAYTVELVDPNGLGGRTPGGRTDLPPGPRPGPSETAEAPPAHAPEAVAKTEPPEPPPPKEAAKPPEPPPTAAEPPKPPPPPEPEVKLPSPEKPPPKPEAAKPPEPTPKVEAKPEPKPQPPPKPQAEAKKPEPPKAQPPKTEPAKAEPAKPVETKVLAHSSAAPASEGSEPRDAYAAAADKWRAKGGTGGGGGLAATSSGSGPIGSPGYGGGGQVVGLEFVAYQQRVIATVKAAWVNAVTRPGLVAKVRFEIAANGEVSNVRLEQSSGDSAYDTSTLRAVQRANPLPTPPSRYANDFRDFVIEFKSEEGGQGAG